MRLVCAFAFAAFLALLPASLEAKIVCGNFDGQFTCRREASPPKVKGAIPSAQPAPSASPENMPSGQDAPAPGNWTTGTQAPDGSACQGGPLPAEFGAAWRQLRALHRVDLFERARGRRPAASL
jgi:hypothetical protein